MRRGSWTLALLLLTPGCRPEGEPRPAARGEGTVIGLVDGEQITREAFVDALLESQGDAFFPRYVERVLIEREAKKAGVTVDEAALTRAVEAEIQDAIRTRFGGDREALVDQVGKYGLTFDAWRQARLRDKRQQMLVEGILRDQVGDQRVRQLFEQRYGKNGQRRRISHILISTQLANSRFYTRKDYDQELEAVTDQARQQAADLRRKALGGGDFEALAREWSDDLSAKQGGRLDSRWSGRFGRAFDETVERLGVGQVSPVVEGKRGFHVIRIDGVRKGADYRGSAILVSSRPRGANDPATDEARVEQARQRALALQARITGGEAFADVARAESDDPSTRANGGDLGDFGPGRLGDAVDPVLETLPIGEVSQPVQVDDGFVLVQLEKRDFKPGQDKKLVSHILISTEYTKVKERRLKPTLEDKARQKAEQLLAEITAGADLAALAREHSEDELTRRVGGQLPNYREDQLGKAVDQALTEMKPEDVRVVRSDQGFHVLRLDAVIQSDFDKVKAELTEELKRKPVSEDDVKGYINEIRAKAQVEKKF